MLSLESEYRELYTAGVIDDAAAVRTIAAERGTIFSVSEELRVSIYGSVAAITAGIGIYLKANLHRIGSLSLIIVLAVAAAACYLPAIRTWLRHATRSTVRDYLLLLGALIFSADLGYAESQFHWLGSHWSLYLLLLCCAHAVTAYVLDSRLVLSVSLASLAAWFGIEGNVLELLQKGNPLPLYGMRALVCAGAIFAWREVHRRLGAVRQFQETFEHFAVNLGFCGAIALGLGSDTRLTGVAYLVALAVVTIRHGLRNARELFVIYGVAYTALGFLCLEGQVIKGSLSAAVAGLLTIIGAVMVTWHLHRRMKGSEP